MKTIAELLLIALPVILAAIFHMVVVSKNWGKQLTYPIDHYATFRGKRIFGDNKTYRGVIVMIGASILFSYGYYLWVFNSTTIASYNLLRYDLHSPLFYGVLMGLGYVIGELPNSFLKRQLEINPGKSLNFVQRLIDQLDSVIVILFLYIFFSDFTWFHFWTGILFYGLLHLAINYTLYLLNLRKEPF